MHKYVYAKKVKSYTTYIYMNINISHISWQRTYSNTYCFVETRIPQPGELMMRNPHEVDFGSHRAIIKHFCGWEFHRSTFMYTYYLDPQRSCQLKKLGWQSAISWGLNFRSPHFRFADVSFDHSLKSDIGMIPLDESWWIIWEIPPEADIAIEEHQLWQMSCSCWDGFQTRSCCYYAEATLWSPTALKFFLPSPGEAAILQQCDNAIFDFPSFCPNYNQRNYKESTWVFP